MVKVCDTVLSINIRTETDPAVGTWNFEFANCRIAAQRASFSGYRRAGQGSDLSLLVFVGRIMLIVFSGLPDTGKTFVAKKLVFTAGALYLRIDAITKRFETPVRLRKMWGAVVTSC